MTKSALIQRRFLEKLIETNYKKSENYDFKICLMPIEKLDNFSEEFNVDKNDIFASK